MPETGQKVMVGISPDMASALTESGSILSIEVLQERMFVNQTYLAIEVEVMKVKTSTADKEKDKLKTKTELQVEVEVEVEVATPSTNSVPERKSSEPNILERMKKVAGPSANAQLASILGGASAPLKSSANLTQESKDTNNAVDTISSSPSPLPSTSSSNAEAVPQGQVNPLQDKATVPSTIEKAISYVDPGADTVTATTTTTTTIAAPDISIGSGLGSGSGSGTSWGVVTQLQLMQQTIATVQQSMIQLHSKVWIHACMYVHIKMYGITVCMYRSMYTWK